MLSTSLNQWDTHQFPPMFDLLEWMMTQWTSFTHQHAMCLTPQGVKQNPPSSEIIIIIVIILHNVARLDGQESHDCTNPGAQKQEGFQPVSDGRWSEDFPKHHVSAAENAAPEVRFRRLFRALCASTVTGNASQPADCF